MILEIMPRFIKDNFRLCWSCLSEPNIFQFLHFNYERDNGAAVRLNVLSYLQHNAAVSANQKQEHLQRTNRRPADLKCGVVVLPSAGLLAKTVIS